MSNKFESAFIIALQVGKQFKASREAAIHYHFEGDAERIAQHNAELAEKRRQMISTLVSVASITVAAILFLTTAGQWIYTLASMGGRMSDVTQLIPIIVGPTAFVLFGLRGKFNSENGLRNFIRIFGSIVAFAWVAMIFTILRILLKVPGAIIYGEAIAVTLIITALFIAVWAVNTSERRLNSNHQPKNIVGKTLNDLAGGLRRFYNLPPAAAFLIPSALLTVGIVLSSLTSMPEAQQPDSQTVAGQTPSAVTETPTAPVVTPTQEPTTYEGIEVIYFDQIRANYSDVFIGQEDNKSILNKVAPICVGITRYGETPEVAMKRVLGAFHFTNEPTAEQAQGITALTVQYACPHFGKES